MYSFLWLASIIIFLILEAATYQFICIWFAGGSLGALIASMFGASLSLQITAFFAVSVLLLVLTRPAVKKLTANKGIKTNIEEVPGKTALVTEKIDNTIGTGKAKLDGMEWTARSVDGDVIEKGKKVTVESVSGVKLMVKGE